MSVVAVGMLVAGSVSGAVPNSSSTTLRATTGTGTGTGTSGTAYWAESPGASPDWILPFQSLAYFSVSNMQDFQMLMYRPLYWFGQITTAKPTFDEALSTAEAPVWSDGDKTVTITMKGWKWSNGLSVDASDVMFWLNMLKAERTEYAGYSPGLMPDNISSYSGDAATDSITLHLRRSYSPTWYLYNQLSEITPMPRTWDITSAGAAAGSGGCSALQVTALVLSKCAKVWAFLTDDNGLSSPPREAANRATYATNPLWKVVDGPWHLTSFNANGRATFAPNPHYSGPVKPRLSWFVEVPYSSAAAELNALEAAGSQAPTVGYVLSDELPENTGPPGSTGGNAYGLTSYRLEPVYGWSVNYFPENFNSNGDSGQARFIFRQLYFRQALQLLVNQPSIIKTADRGYGTLSTGPVPLLPKNPFSSALEASNPYPYDAAQAKALLSKHGWTVRPDGISTCSDPTECGAGIKKGAALNFTELYVQGVPSLQQTMDEEVTAWNSAGIKVTLKGMSFFGVLNTAAPCTASQSRCSWEFANWGGGWIYSPDYLPTGEELFASGAVSNPGSYSSADADRLIAATTESSSSTALRLYENYLARQLPVVWQPNPPNALAEISTHLTGATPINALLNLTPEYWQLNG